MRKAAVRAELERWGLGDTLADPSQVLLRLVAQSSRRCEYLALLPAEAAAAAEEGAQTTTLPARISVLVGSAFALSRDGDAVPVGEVVRALVELEQRERKLCGDLAATAIAAGLETRLVEQAERTGSAIAEVLRAIMADRELGLSDAQRQVFPAAIKRVLAIAPGAG